MSASAIPGFDALRGFVGRRGWLRNLLVVEAILVVGAFGLDAMGTAATAAAGDPASTGNAETVTILAAMLGAYALLLGLVGGAVLLVSIVLAARRADHVIDAA